MRIIVIYLIRSFFLFPQKAVSKSQCEVEVLAILAYFVQAMIRLLVSYRTIVQFMAQFPEIRRLRLKRLPNERRMRDSEVEVWKIDVFISMNDRQEEYQER